jgi:hypothetical protein
MMGEKLGIFPHVAESVLGHVSGTKRGVAGGTIVRSTARNVQPPCNGGPTTW